jgi:predicted glycosyltransferase
LLAEFDSVAPAAVVFETFPFGRRALHFELLPLLERIEGARRRPLVVASVRDILQRRRDPGREREMLELARGAFDAVLVHGDRRFMRLEETFALAPGSHARALHGIRGGRQ